MKILDRSWRLSHLYSIVNKAGDKIPFVPNDIQTLINENTSKRKIILKARQFGVSTNEIIKQLDFVLFTRNANACILAHEQDAVRKLFRIAKRAYDFIPDKLKPEIDRGGGSKYEMYFPSINSRIYCDLESRGDTIHYLHVSEAAFMKDSSRLKSTLQAVPLETGRVTIETTPNGMGNYFYDLWTDPDQPYSKLFFPWFMFPDYKMRADGTKFTEEEKEFARKAFKNYGVSISHEQLAFRRYKKSELKSTAADRIRVTFEQEYPEDDQSCFLSSGESVMDLFKIKELIDSAKDPIEDDGWIKVYEPVKNNHEYMIGADTAEGSGGDYSVAIVLNSTTKRLTAKIRGHWKPFEFARLLSELGLRFKNLLGFPLLAVERNNHGHAVLLELEEHLNYPNLYRHSDEKLGWKTDMITRPVMINQFIHAVESGFLSVSDKELLAECLTLVNINGKIQAADNKHDDCVIAAAIGLQMVLKSSTLGLYEDIENKILL